MIFSPLTYKRHSKFKETLFSKIPECKRCFDSPYKTATSYPSLFKNIIGGKNGHKKAEFVSETQKKPQNGHKKAEFVSETRGKPQNEHKKTTNLRLNDREEETTNGKAMRRYRCGDSGRVNKKDRPKIAFDRSFECRGTVTRTLDPLVPNQMRYQLRHTPSVLEKRTANILPYFTIRKFFAKILRQKYGQLTSRRCNDRRKGLRLNCFR